MPYRLIKLILISLFILSCEQTISNKSKFKKDILINKYQNSGFTLIYNDNLTNLYELVAAPP